MAMKIHLAFICYNRVEYTKLSLASILADPSEVFSLTIWDNASTDGTAEYLKNEVHDTRIEDMVFSKTNIGQIAAINHIWGNSKADLLGKLDNDCLVTPGWTRILAQAHVNIPQLGAVACWHYPLDEFDEEAARRAGKIQAFNGYEILRHPWTCGTGLLIKRETYVQFGPMQSDTTTHYWKKLAQAGYINGFYFPLVPQEHMDDPRSSYCLIRDDESLHASRETTVVLRNHGIKTMKARWWRRKLVLRNLNSGPWDIKHYVGLRGRLRRATEIVSRMFCV